MKGYQGFTLGCLLLPVAALAQVPVMEGSGNTGYYPQQQAPRLPDTRSASAGLSAEGQLLLQLDQMQQEVSMLRGLLEEQKYRLKTLEQDQLGGDQYIVRRPSSRSAGTPAPSGDSRAASPGRAPVTPTSPRQTGSSPPAEARPEREKLLYEAAFERV